MDYVPLNNGRVLYAVDDRGPLVKAWYLYGYDEGSYAWVQESQFRRSDDRDLVYAWANSELQYFGYNRGAAIALSDPEEIPIFVGASVFLAEAPDDIVLIEEVSINPRLVGP